MTYSWTENILNRLGLWKAVQGVPGLTPIAVLSIALAYFLFGKLGISEPLRGLAAAVVGLLLALVGYHAGDFWDSTLFNPKYGLKGRWINRDTRPYHLFAAGEDLKICRKRAIGRVFGVEHSGVGIYRECLLVAKAAKSQWREIENPLILSKFVRSVIWPCVVLGIALLGIGAWKRFEDVKHSDPLLVIGGVSSLILSAIVLVPYFNLRVEHMMRLYEFVGKQRRTTDRKQSPASPAGGLAGSRGKSASSRKKKKSDEANPT